MQPEDPAALVRRIAELKAEHRQLDALIAHWSLDPGNDELEIKRLKRRKLHLKDSIALLQSRLIPDLDA